MESCTETEVKVEIQERELQEVRRRFEELGCRQKVVRTREENLLFDGPDEHLKKSGSALRLRQYGSKCLLTFKGPRLEDERLKIREEIETEGDDRPVGPPVTERPDVLDPGLAAIRVEKCAACVHPVDSIRRSRSAAGFRGVHGERLDAERGRSSRPADRAVGRLL